MMATTCFETLHYVYEVVPDVGDCEDTSWFTYQLAPTNVHENYDPEDYTSAKCFAEWYSCENGCDVAVITVKPIEILTMRNEEVINKCKIGAPVC